MQKFRFRQNSLGNRIKESSNHLSMKDKSMLAHIITTILWDKVNVKYSTRDLVVLN